LSAFSTSRGPWTCCAGRSRAIGSPTHTPSSAPRAPAAASAVLVPADAVRTDGAVFVYADGKVERRSVTPGQSVGAEREVLKGLRAGERVVVAPPLSLKDGASVRVAEK